MSIFICSCVAVPGSAPRFNRILFSSSVLKTFSNAEPADTISGDEKSPEAISKRILYSAAALKPNSGCVHFTVSAGIPSFASSRIILSLLRLTVVVKSSFITTTSSFSQLIIKAEKVSKNNILFIYFFMIYLCFKLVTIVLLQRWICYDI